MGVIDDNLGILNKTKLRLAEYENLLRLARFLKINYPEIFSHKSLVKIVWHEIKSSRRLSNKEFLELVLKVKSVDC